MWPWGMHGRGSSWTAAEQSWARACASGHVLQRGLFWAFLMPEFPLPNLCEPSLPSLQGRGNPEPSTHCT